jgi:hypothetical protein
MASLDTTGRTAKTGKTERMALMESLVSVVYPERKETLVMMVSRAVMAMTVSKERGVKLDQQEKTENQEQEENQVLQDPLESPKTVLSANRLLPSVAVEDKQ